MSFAITLQPSLRHFEAPSDEPILNAAIRAGIGLPYGCKDGACGSCKCRLLSGEVHLGPHQDKALSAAEAAAGLILSCVAHPRSDCVVEARGVTGEGEFPVLRMPGRILSLRRPTPDVAVLRVQLPANQNFQYRAGQYVDILLRDGDRRSYSMANAPHQLGTPPAIELHIRHMPGGKFTDQVFSTLKEKDIVRMEGPFGSFSLREESNLPMILLASGTGLAPIKALIERMQAQQITRPAVLYWGCRRPADLYFHEWALATAAAMPQLSYVPVLSDLRAEDGWAGRTGLVHDAVVADWPDLSGHEVYACGAPVMVEAARHAFTSRLGLPVDAFFADSFTSAADKAA